MMTKDKVTMLYEELDKRGYKVYANLLKPYISDNRDREKKIAVIGGASVGKSTFINEVIGKNIIPTGIIPTKTKIDICFGENEKAISAEGEILDIENLKQCMKCIDDLEVQIKSENFEDGIELIEIPDFMESKSDIDMIIEISKYDAIIFVMTAESLLNEKEQYFIKKYIHWVDSSRLLIVVKKLDLIDKDERDSLIQYFDTQKQIQFPNVKCFVEKNDNGYLSDIKSVIDIINDWGRTEKPVDGLLEETIQYIQIKLKEEKNRLDENTKEEEQRQEKQEQYRNEQKQKQEIMVEKAGIEFQKRRHFLIEETDTFLKKRFSNLKEYIIKEMTNAKDSIVWYKEQLAICVETETKKMSYEVDNYVNKRIEEDLLWLNSTLQTELGMSNIHTAIDSHSIHSIDDVKDYGKIKKIMPFGIGGSAILGFNLFKVIGAAIGITGTSLLFGTIIYQDAIQKENIQHQINRDLEELSSNARKLATIEVERVYDDTLEAFKKKTKEIIGLNDRVIEEIQNEPDDKIVDIKELILLMEE